MTFKVVMLVLAMNTGQANLYTSKKAPSFDTLAACKQFVEKLEEENLSDVFLENHNTYMKALCLPVIGRPT